MIVGAGRRRRLLLAARPRRGPGLHLPHHGGHARPGRARPSTRPSCRSPSASSARCRRPEPRQAAQLHPAGTDHDLRRPEGQSTPPAEVAGHLVPGAQERGRHAPHPAPGHRRPRSSTTSSATPSASSTASPPTASRHRELRDYVEEARSRLLRVPDVSKVDILGAQDERIFIEFSTERLAGLGLRPRRADRGAAGAEHRAPRRRASQTGDEAHARCASPAPSSPRRTSLAVNFAIGDRMLRLGDIAEVRRGFADPPQPMFRVNGEPAIGLAIAMRDGGDILALGRNIAQAMQRHQRRPAARHRAAPGGRPAGDGRRGDQRVHRPRCGRRSRSSWW